MEAFDLNDGDVVQGCGNLVGITAARSPDGLGNTGNIGGTAVVRGDGLRAAPVAVTLKVNRTSILDRRRRVLVCHCKVVYQRDVLAAIAAGARDEFDVAAACGAGAGCGGCVPAVSALLAEQGCAPGCPVVEALHSDRAGARTT